MLSGCLFTGRFPKGSAEAMTGQEELGCLPRSSRETPRASGSGREGAGVGCLHADTSPKGWRPLCADWLQPQAGYTQEPRATLGLALLWQPGACKAGVGTTQTAPSPKGQVSPAWKWSPRCLPSSPSSVYLPCQASMGCGGRTGGSIQGGPSPSRVAKGWRTDGRGRAGRWGEAPGAGGSPLK